MAFYRIVIVTSNKTYKGIRELQLDSITAAQGLMEKKARELYKTNLIDVEVQMLAKTCKAVKYYLQKKSKKPLPLNYNPQAYGQKKSQDNPRPLGERNKPGE